MRQHRTYFTNGALEPAGNLVGKAFECDLFTVQPLEFAAQQVKLPIHALRARTRLMPDFERGESERDRERDVVAEDRLTSDARAERGSYVGCIAGALSKSEYIAGLEAAGFEDVSVQFTHEVADGMHGAIVKAVKTREPERAELPVVQPAERSVCR